MTAIVLMVGAAGCWFLITSIPTLHGRRVRSRVEPFLHGLGGRPSRLLVRTSASAGTMFGRWISRSGLVGNPGIQARLEALGGGVDEVAFRLEQLVWAGTAAVCTAAAYVVAALSGVISPSPSFIAAVGMAAITAALGRDWYLSREVEKRQLALKEQLPTAIDHMTLALLAGCAIATVFARIAEDAPPAVAAEFARIDADIRGGGTVIDGLEAFAARIPDPAIARFVDSLCTAIERGTSVADTLRAQADDVREAKRRHLLEIGGRREVLMLVPVVFLIMPVIVLFALYPGLVSLDLLVP